MSMDAFTLHASLDAVALPEVGCNSIEVSPDVATNGTNDMAQLAANRKQRLRTLEKSIRGTMEQFVETGNALKEIRDDELYKADGFDTWDAYLKQRVGADFGIEKNQALNLIQASIIRPKLPSLQSISTKVDIDSDVPQWKPTVVKEFARLAPPREGVVGRPGPDVEMLRKQDVQRVAKAAVVIAEERGKPVTAAIVREAVNADLGIVPEPRVASKPEQVGIDLPVYLQQKIGQIEGITELLAEVPAMGWKQLEKSHPQLAMRLATVCDNLAELLRS